MSSLTHNKQPWVNKTIHSNNGTKFPGRAPAFQRIEYKHRVGRKVFDLENVGTGFWQTTQPKDFFVDMNEVDKIKKMYLRYKITENGTDAATPTPAQTWTNRIDILEQGSNRPIQSVFTEDLIVRQNFDLDPSEKDDVLDSANMSENWFVSKRIAIAASGTATFVVELPGPWKNQHWYVGNMKKKLNIRITPNGDINYSGSGVLQSTSIELIVETDVMSEADKQAHLNSNLAQPSVADFLDCMELNYSAETLTAGSKFTKKIGDSLEGKDVAFMVVAIRPDSYYQDNTTCNSLQLCQLGDHNSGSLDVEDAAGNSIYGLGSAVNGAMTLKHLWKRQGAKSDLHKFRAFYIIPFCSNAASALKGKRDGYYTFNGGERLALTPVAGTGTAATSVITCTNSANDGGFYKLQFKGDTTGANAHNDNAAAIKADLEALDSSIQHPYGPLVWTSSGTLEATATMTAKLPGTSSGYASDCLKDDEKVVLIAESLNDGSVAEKSSTANTKGVAGFETGAYDITVYAYYYRQCIQHRGSIMSR